MSLIRSDKHLYKEESKKLLSNLEQWEVYNSSENCVVLAGPGSGKSKVLTLKIAKLLNEEIQQPQGVACITYNKECAKELKEKLTSLGVQESSTVFIGTVHSFCLNHIIKPFKHLVKTDLPQEICIANSNQINIALRNSFNQTIGKNKKYSKYWKTAFDKYRRTYIDRTSSNWINDDPDISTWIIDYERQLRSQELIDYDDMVLNGLWMIEKNEWIRDLLKAKFPAIVVDEYQDLGVALDQIIRTLCIQNGIRLLAVGDPDQSIYSFTGANPELLKKLSKSDKVKKVILKKNYRSKENIIKASMTTLKEERDFTSNQGHGGHIKFYNIKNGIEKQAEFICESIIPQLLSLDPSNSLGDIGILYIDKNDGDFIAKTVSDHGYSFIRVDGNAPYGKSEITIWIEECAAWCSGGWKLGKPRFSELEKKLDYFHQNNSDYLKKTEEERQHFWKFMESNKKETISLKKWIKEFDRDIISKFISLLEPGTDSVIDYENLFRFICDQTDKNTKISFLTNQNGNCLNLYTLHSSKGLEFKYVIIFGLEEGRLPWLNVSEEKILESGRLFYVGITRAKEEIHLLYSGWYLDYWKNYRINGPSRFVEELLACFPEEPKFIS